MKIDMHYYGTYAAALCAGIKPERAARIATFAQFVDDQTEDGYHKYDNGEILHYRRTAHSGLDYADVASLENSDVWPVFHFPPIGLNGARHVDGGWKCRPISCSRHDIDRAGVMHELQDAAKGVAAHMLLDSYAHEGFSGLPDEINRIENLTVRSPHGNWAERVLQFFGSAAIEEITTIGHGPVLSLPDRCNAVYEYDQDGVHVLRDNPGIYRAAFKALVEFFGGGSCPDDHFWEILVGHLNHAHSDSYLDVSCTYWTAAIGDGVFGQPHIPEKYYEPEPWDDEFYEFAIAAEAIRSHYKTRLFPPYGMVY